MVLSLVEKSHRNPQELQYNQIVEGILTQKPELAEIANHCLEMGKNLSGDEYLKAEKEYFDSLEKEGKLLPKEIELKTIVPDENAPTLPSQTLRIFTERVNKGIPGESVHGTEDGRETQQTTTATGGGTENNFAKIHQNLKERGKSYDLYTDEDGENAVMIVSVAGERPSPNAGVPFTYTVYKFDKDGNILEGFPIEGLTQKATKQYKLKNHQYIENRTTDTSGVLYSFGITLPSGIRRLLDKAFTNKDDFKARTPEEIRNVIEKWADNPYWIKNHQNFIEQLGNLDYKNIEAHLKHIKNLIDEGIDPMIAFSNGYFSSADNVI